MEGRSSGWPWRRLLSLLRDIDDDLRTDQRNARVASRMHDVEHPQAVFFQRRRGAANRVPVLNDLLRVFDGREFRSQPPGEASRSGYREHVLPDFLAEF